MDIKEIERLHAQYAAPPVTIEMEASGTTRLDALSAAQPSQPPSQGGHSIVARIRPIHWKCLGILAIAVLAFGGGRWLASNEAHKASTKTAAAQPEATGSPPTDSGHEWPASQPSVSQPPVALGPPTIAPPAAPETHSGASASTPTPAQSHAKPQPPKVQAPKQPASVPTPARQSVASPAPSNPAPPPAGRGNEIKLF